MKREFVPYELALKLKELGFEEPCFAMWTQGWSEFEWSSSMLPRIFSSKFRLNDTQSCGTYINYPESPYGVAAPTYSQAFKFFRDNYRLSVLIHNCLDDYIGEIVEWTLTDNKIIHEVPNRIETYEETELKSLEMLIEIVESKSK
jgi:hypothetical protein